MGKERVTVVDIARAAGVSKSTVSLVLQASPLVNESTRAKVNAVIRELGYVYNRSAANLRQARSKIIGIVVNDLTNSFFAELAVGVDEVVQTAGFVQFLANTSEKLDPSARSSLRCASTGCRGSSYPRRAERKPRISRRSLPPAFRSCSSCATFPAPVYPL